MDSASLQVWPMPCARFYFYCIVLFIFYFYEFVGCCAAGLAVTASPIKQAPPAAAVGIWDV
jgi:hypothetical protein